MNRSIFIVVAALLIPGNWSLAQTSRPADVQVTNHDMFRAVLAYNTRTLVGAYEQSGRKNPKWDTEARAFLEIVAQRWARRAVSGFYAPRMDLTHKTVLKLANAATEAGCDDPLVRYCRARMMLDSNGKTPEYLAQLRQCIPDLLTGDYPAMRKCSAASIFLAECKPDPNDPLTNQTRKAAVEQLVKAIIAPESDPLERRIKFMMTDSNFERMNRQERDGCQTALKEAGADPWLLAVIDGRNEITAAWEARGDGWAAEVTPEGWRGFYEHLGKARQALVDANQLEPDYPEAAAMMITVAMGAGDELNESERDWFDTAFQAQIDFAPAWDNFSHGLKPRWGGSHRKMYELGCQAAMTGRFDTDVPYYLPAVLKEIAADKQEYRFLFKEPGLGRNVDRVFEGYVAHPMPGMNMDWIKSSRAAFAFRCQNYEQVVKIADEMKKSLRANAFMELELDMDDAVTMSRGIIADVTGELRGAFAQEQEQNWRAAGERYSTVLNAAAEDHPAHNLAGSHLLVTSLLADLSEGKRTQVPLQKPDDLLAWKGDKTLWTCNADGLTFSATKAQNSNLRHLARFLHKDHPGDFHPGRRIILEWCWSTPDPTQLPHLGVFLQDIGTDVISLQADPGASELFLGTAHWSIMRSGKIDPKLLEPDRWHQLEINHAKESVTVKLDGQLVIDNATNDWLDRGDPMLALWSASPACGGTFRVRNLSISPLRVD